MDYFNSKSGRNAGASKAIGLRLKELFGELKIT
jgi:hypothetical protein